MKGEVSNWKFPNATRERLASWKSQSSRNIARNDTVLEAIHPTEKTWLREYGVRSSCLLENHRDAKGPTALEDKSTELGGIHIE